MIFLFSSLITKSTFSTESTIGLISIHKATFGATASSADFAGCLVCIDKSILATTSTTYL